MSDTFTLPRSGQAPLSFNGTLIKESDGKQHAGKEHNRYHRIAVYRTASGKYVLAVNYESNWQGETGHASAEVFAKPDAIAAALQAYDPTKHVAGFPPHAAYAAKQERLLVDIRARYESQVSDILAAAPEFAEKVS